VRLNITLRGSEGLYEKTILGITRIKQTYGGTVEIYRTIELVVYGPEEWSEYELMEED
jgi:hypothetical protein